MGIQADLLGAHAMDIRNILAMTGDPPRTGDYVNATAVFDVDAIGLIRVLASMNAGLDATGNSVGEPTAFCVGAALNPGGEEPSREMERFLAKVEAGARWAQTQPVYDLEVLERFFARTRSPVPVVVGLLPLALLAPRGVPAQRGAGHHRARRGPRAHARGGRARSPRRRRHGAGADRTCAPTLCGCLSHAVLRPVRGGGRGPGGHSLTHDPLSRPLPRLTGLDLCVRARRTPGNWTEALLERIDKIEPTVKAWVHLDREGARRTARERAAQAAAGVFVGPLHGVPVALKDIFDVAGLPTRAGANAFAHRQPGTDAASVARLRAAGAVILGKVTTTTFALIDPEPDAQSVECRAHARRLVLRAPPRRWARAWCRWPSARRRWARCCGRPPTAAWSGFKPTHGRISAAGVVPAVLEH